jgi:hypothetical protein
MASSHRLASTLAVVTALLVNACGGGQQDSPGAAVVLPAGTGGGTAGGQAGAPMAGNGGTAGAATGGAGPAGTGGATGGAGKSGAGTGGAAGGAGKSGGSATAGTGGGKGGAGGAAGASGNAGASGAGGLASCPCFAKVAWCGAGVVKQAATMGCEVDVAAENAGDILYCPDGPTGEWALKEACQYGCVEAPVGTPDTCKPKPEPECPCFVTSAWCGTGAAKQADAMGCTIPLLPDHASDLLYCPNGKWAVKQACDFGCNEAPTGTPDTCKSDPSSVCTLLSPPHGAQLKWGLHPDASDALRAIGVTAAGISQTIGSAAASAGTHAQDGTSGGYEYSAATDLRITGMSSTEIGAFLDDLAKAGFVAWYRHPGYDGWPASEAPHVHAIWVGAKMKLSLRNQVRDFMAGKNGLASHTHYSFHTWSQCIKDALWKRYLMYNSATN